MKPITHALTFSVCIALGGCSWLELKRLNGQIDAKKRELATVTEELAGAAGPDLTPSRDLQADLKYRPISEWAREMTNPLRITAVGIASEGDLRYRRGVYKVWVRVPGDSKISASIDQLTLDAKEGGLEWSARTYASAETWVYFSILGGENIHCRGASAPVVAGGSIQMGEATTTVPYSINLTRPNNIPAIVICGLGGLGDLPISFNISDLARVLSEGKFDLGFTSKGKFSVPAPGHEKVYEYKISPKDASFFPHTWGLRYQTNLDVTVAPMNTE